MAIRIALATNVEWAVEVDHQKPLAADRAGRLLPDRFIGRDKGGDDDHPRLVKKPGDFCTSPQVLAPVVGRKAQVFADAAAHVLAIEDDHGPTLIEQFSFQGIRERALAAAREAGEQQRCRLLAKSGLALLAGDTRPLVVRAYGCRLVVPMLVAGLVGAPLRDHARPDRAVRRTIDSDV